MLKKILLATVTSVFLLLSAGASADAVSAVYSCTLNEGKTSEDAHAVNAQWLSWARSKAGTDEISSSFVTAIVGKFEGFMWVDTYKDLATWAKVNAASLRDDNPELADAFDALQECESNRLYNIEPTTAAE